MPQRQRVADRAGVHVALEDAARLQIAREHVGGQRTAARVDELDRLTGVLHHDHRQDGAEDLLPHHRGVRRGAEQHGRRDVPVDTVGLPAADDLAGGVVRVALLRQQSGQPVEMALVDDAGEAVRGLRILAVELGDGQRDAFGQHLGHVRRGQHIVRCHTGLAGVGEFTPRDAPGRGGQRHGAVDEAGRFAAQFQRDRGQILGGGLHDDAADAPAAGIEDMVERLGQQIRGLLRAALHDGDGAGVHVPFDEFGGQMGDMRRELRRFQADRVAGGDGVDHRFQRQQHRIVPRRDDQDHALGLVDGPADGGLQQPMHRLGVARRPPAHTATDEVRLAQHQIDLHQQRLRGRLAQIRGDRVDDGLLVLGDHAAQRVELTAAPRQRLGDAGGIGVAQPVEYFMGHVERLLVTCGR